MKNYRQIPSIKNGTIEIHENTWKYVVCKMGQKCWKNVKLYIECML